MHYLFGYGERAFHKRRRSGYLIFESESSFRCVHEMGNGSPDFGPGNAYDAPSLMACTVIYVECHVWSALSVQSVSRRIVPRGCVPRLIRGCDARPEPE